MPSARPAEREERRLLAAARDGDEAAFERLVDPYRGELQAHCYRMLGSVHDAEDALQDALLRVWRGLAGLRGPRRRRAARLALPDRHQRLARPDRPAPAAAACPPTWRRARTPTRRPAGRWWRRSGSSPGAKRRPSPTRRRGPGERAEERESLELAFVAAMQQLPARQRAVLILREVLGFSAAEVGETLETSVPSVNSALQRARAAVDERVGGRSQAATLRELGDARTRRDRRRLHARRWRPATCRGSSRC